MAPSRSVTACLQRNLLRQNPLRISTQCPRLTRQFSQPSLSRPRTFMLRIPNQQHAFSISIPQRFAVTNDTFDPKSVDRESDQVNVCIVGGGMAVKSMS